MVIFCFLDGGVGWGVGVVLVGDVDDVGVVVGVGIVLLVVVFGSR